MRTMQNPGEVLVHHLLEFNKVETFLARMSICHSLFKNFRDPAGHQDMVDIYYIKPDSKLLLIVLNSQHCLP